jgi:hypothetical protein
MAQLIAKTLSIKELNIAQIDRMFEVFQKYYFNADRETFIKDLKDKDIVFLLLDSRDKSIQGFSTLKNIIVELKNKKYRTAFSGDTIIEKEYWGSGALGVAFLRYLLIQKCKNPFKPLYWFLISKGYKTYLLMANNFPVHYPRYERVTPQREESLMRAMGIALYQNRYDESRGLIRFEESAKKDALKEDVAPVTIDLLKNERISYFVKKNPQWARGDELACLAEMTLSMPVRYQIKIMQKKLKRSMTNSWSKVSQLLGLGTAR